MSPRNARRLDLVGDGTRLIQLPLRPLAARGRQAAPPAIESVVIPPGERLLVLEAERIPRQRDARGPVQGTVPGEIITVRPAWRIRARRASSSRAATRRARRRP